LEACDAINHLTNKLAPNVTTDNGLTARHSPFKFYPIHLCPELAVPALQTDTVSSIITIHLLGIPHYLELLKHFSGDNFLVYASPCDDTPEGSLEQG
jgi:hypothetical protein